MRTTDSDLELCGEISPEQLKALPMKTIDELMVILNMQKARLDADIHDAQVDFRERGCYANSKWFKKAVAASKNKGVQLQVLNRELGERNREIKREDSLRYERMFMNVAYERLPKDRYNALIHETMLRCGMTPKSLTDPG